MFGLIGMASEGNGVELHQELVLKPRPWRDYTTDGSMDEVLGWSARPTKLEEYDSITEAKPILMLPPMARSDWVLKKVAELKRRLGYNFKEVERRVEDFFWEIERRRS